jgi:hypothetical protein
MSGLNKQVAEASFRFLFASSSSIYGRRWSFIPPQVQWYVDYRIFDVVTGATIAATDEHCNRLLPFRHSRTS